jgi:hypothetical protein
MIMKSFDRPARYLNLLTLTLVPLCFVNLHPEGRPWSCLPTPLLFGPRLGQSIDVDPDNFCTHRETNFELGCTDRMQVETNASHLQSSRLNRRRHQETGTKAIGMKPVLGQWITDVRI